tara:strand:- start:1609 stop:1758 length:150 start_codon:yes stop_codon:yes gene_type:complete
MPTAVLLALQAHALGNSWIDSAKLDGIDVSAFRELRKSKGVRETLNEMV